MGMSFWEFRSETLNCVGEVIGALPNLACLTDLAELIHGHDDQYPAGAHAALEAVVGAVARIDQMVIEGDLAYDDGGRLPDDEVERRLADHYGERRTPTWHEEDLQVEIADGS